VGNRCRGDPPKPPTANRGDDDDFASNAAAGCRHNQHDDGRNKRPGTGTLQSKSPPGTGVDLAGGFPLFTDGVRSASSSGDAEVSACDGGERKGAKGGGDRQQRPQQQRHEGGSSCAAVSGTRNFYDPYEIALRSRRLFDAYGRDDVGDGRGGSLTPGHTGAVRCTKVMVRKIVLRVSGCTSFAISAQNKTSLEPRHSASTAHPAHKTFGRK